jgi:RNA polymerase sigma factor (sigma-70 family)
MENQTNFYRSRWVQTYEENSQRLASYARHLARGNIADADDLIQETICRVLHHGSNASRIENLFSYMLKVMQNAWISKRMKECQVSTESLDDLIARRALKKEPVINPEVLQVLENQDFQRAFNASKGKLSVPEKEILSLYLAGYTCDEIADKLKEDEQIIRMRINAVKSKVRYRLKIRQEKMSSAKDAKPA